MVQVKSYTLGYRSDLVRQRISVRLNKKIPVYIRMKTGKFAGSIGKLQGMGLWNLTLAFDNRSTISYRKINSSLEYLPTYKGPANQIVAEKQKAMPATMNDVRNNELSIGDIVVYVDHFNNAATLGYGAVKEISIKSSSYPCTEINSFLNKKPVFIYNKDKILKITNSDLSNDAILSKLGG